MIRNITARFFSAVPNAATRAKVVYYPSSLVLRDFYNRMAPVIEKATKLGGIVRARETVLPGQIYSYFFLDFSRNDDLSKAVAELNNLQLDSDCKVHVAATTNAASNSLYVREAWSQSYSESTKQQLSKLFEKCGSPKLLSNPVFPSGHPTGFAIVEFADATACDKACKELNGVMGWAGVNIRMIRLPAGKSKEGEDNQQQH